MERVVQFGVPSSLSVWLQRTGRAGRNPSIQAEATMLVESSVFKKQKKKAKKKSLTKDANADVTDEESSDSDTDDDVDAT